MKIECHVIQNFAPSCLNRDDTNTPKECDFGGVRRARISSQSFKRAIREYFRDRNSVPVGERTKALRGEIMKIEPGADTKALDAVLSALASADKKRGQTETSVLLFLGQEEIAALARCVRDGITDKKKVQESVVAAGMSVDVALFGRMLAEAPDVNVDAATQVAHALSTHAVELEMDFFTAVDDLNRREDVGAGMLGYTGFQSACLYRYALLDTEQLRKNLGGDRDMTRRGVEAFLWAFFDAEPKARQNSMPAHNRPSLGLLVARDGGVPTSLANAFCKPVPTGGARPDLVGASVKALAGYHERLGRVYEAFDETTQALFHDLDAEQAEGLGALNQFDAVSERGAIDKILSALEAA